MFLSSFFYELAQGAESKFSTFQAVKTPHADGINAARWEIVKCYCAAEKLPIELVKVPEEIRNRMFTKAGTKVLRRVIGECCGFDVILADRIVSVIERLSKEKVEKFNLLKRVDTSAERLFKLPQDLW